MTSMTCPGCRHPVDEGDRFCRYCGFPLSEAARDTYRPMMPTPGTAAAYWKYFFGPFFKVAFIFFGFFFACAFLAALFWYFNFAR
ncbi:MAG: zinc-ribbon domain-containing protein [Syntrophobacter sp.]